MGATGCTGKRARIAALGSQTDPFRCGAARGGAVRHSRSHSAARTPRYPVTQESTAQQWRRIHLQNMHERWSLRRHDAAVDVTRQMQRARTSHVHTRCRQDREPLGHRPQPRGSRGPDVDEALSVAQALMRSLGVRTRHPYVGAVPAPSPGHVAPAPAPASESESESVQTSFGLSPSLLKRGVRPLAYGRCLKASGPTLNALA